MNCSVQVNILCFSIDTHDVFRLSSDFPCQWVCSYLIIAHLFGNMHHKSTKWNYVSNKLCCTTDHPMTLSEGRSVYTSSKWLHWYPDPPPGCMPLPPSSLSKNFGAFRLSGCNISVLYFELTTAAQHHYDLSSLRSFQCVHQRSLLSTQCNVSMQSRKWLATRYEC